MNNSGVKMPGDTMGCKPGKVCQNCLECFACHAMKEPNIVGNCRPKAQRKCPRRERMVRAAEERGPKQTEGHHTSHVSVVRPGRTGCTEFVPHNSTGRGKIQSILPTPPAQPLIRTDDGNSVSYIIKAPFTMSLDSDGRHIRFSHCPKLSFPSLQYAFDYFHVQEKLHNQRVIQDKWQQHFQAGQQSFDPQQSLQFSKQDVQATQQSHAVQQIQDFQMHLSIYPRNPLKSLSLQAEQLAQNAAQRGYIANALSTCGQASGHGIPLKPNDGLSLVETPTPPRSSGSGSQYQHGIEPSIQTLWDKQDPVHSTGSMGRGWSWTSQACGVDSAERVRGSDSGPNPLPCSYANTVLPQTLYKQDRRVLGVPVSAGIDEIRAGFWLRDLEYTTDRCRATTLEERAVAALRLTRAQEAVDRLCECSEKY